MDIPVQQEVLGTANFADEIFLKMDYDEIINAAKTFDVFRPINDYFWIKKVLLVVGGGTPQRFAQYIKIGKEIQKRDNINLAKYKKTHDGRVVGFKKAKLTKEQTLPYSIYRGTVKLLSDSILACRIEYVKAIVKLSSLVISDDIVVRSIQHILQDSTRLECMTTILKIMADSGRLTKPLHMMRYLPSKNLMPYLRTLPLDIITPKLFRYIRLKHKIENFDEYVRFVSGFPNCYEEFEILFIQCLHKRSVLPSDFKRCLTVKYINYIDRNTYFYRDLVSSRSSKIKRNMIKSSGLFLKDVIKYFPFPHSAKRGKRGKEMKRWKEMGLPLDNIISVITIKLDVTDVLHRSLVYLFKGKPEKFMNKTKGDVYLTWYDNLGAYHYFYPNQRGLEKLDNYFKGAQEGNGSAEYIKNLVATPLSSIKAIKLVYAFDGATETYETKKLAFKALYDYVDELNNKQLHGSEASSSWESKSDDVSEEDASSWESKSDDVSEEESPPPRPFKRLTSKEAGNMLNAQRESSSTDDSS
jgi:hypothetical protein